MMIVQKRFTLLYLFIITSMLLGCSTVPITGRKQMSLFSSQEMHTLSFNQYSNLINTSNKLPDSDKRVKLVRTVGAKISKAVEEYIRHHKKHNSRIKGFEWAFNVIDENQANAFCMPGGKVCFYTGILPITKDELGIAVVMGHEIAHAIAKHGNERMSQSKTAKMGQEAASLVIDGSVNNGSTNSLLKQAVGMGSNLGVLKFSRLHESEADHLGLIFMAMAGYDPKAAVDFWKRMEKMTGGSKQLEFLATHPHNSTRIADIESKIPEAMTYYKK